LLNEGSADALSQDHHIQTSQSAVIRHNGCSNHDRKSNKWIPEVERKRRYKMAYQEEHTERQRMVVETPNSTREVRTERSVIPTEAVSRVRHWPLSFVGVVVLVAITLLFFMYRQQDMCERESRIATAAADDYCPATGTTAARNCSAAGNYYSTGARDRQ